MAWFGCFQKYGYPKIIHFNSRVFHSFHHPFWGVFPLFLGYHYFWKHPFCATLILGMLGWLVPLKQKKLNTLHLIVAEMQQKTSWWSGHVFEDMKSKVMSVHPPISFLTPHLTGSKFTSLAILYEKICIYSRGLKMKNKTSLSARHLLNLVGAQPSPCYSFARHLCSGKWSSRTLMNAHHDQQRPTWRIIPFRLVCS